ncbi:MAG: signal peptidase I [Oscillospiraceae bacterium]|jgi:signal peptidase|nr:signal peptidase I [Oscillospiraceae bacterium]
MAKEKIHTAAGEAKEKSSVGHLIATIIGVVLCAILLPIVIVNLTLVIKSYVHKDEVPTFMGIAPMIVESGSMSPTIEVDDLIFARKIDPASIKAGYLESETPGTVIAFLAKKDTIITHRVVGVITTDEGVREYITKGDWNNTPDDQRVHDDQIIGEYFLRLKGAGKIALFMKEPIGMVLFVGIPLALFVVYDAIRRALFNKKLRKAEQERIAALEGALAQTAPAGGAIVPQEQEPVPAPLTNLEAPTENGESSAEPEAKEGPTTT